MNEVEKKNYTVAVDLGTTNVVVIVGAKNPDGTLYFRKVVSAPVEGMQAGQIVNIVAVYNSIHGVMSEVEAELGTRVSQVYTGISGRFIRCENYTDHVFAQDSQGGISQQDVDALYARMHGVQAPENEIIIERIPQNFKVDTSFIDGSKLVGAFGRQLSATFQFVLCERTPWERLQMLFDKLGIEVLGIYPTMLSIVDSVASPEEREEGVAVVNLGGDKTDLAVIHGNTLRYISSVPIGGAAINGDIHSMGIPRSVVEMMKRQYGSAIADKTAHKQLTIPGRRPHGGAGTIHDDVLATAIEARMLDIIDYVKEELRDSGYDKKLGYGLILAGGGSRLAHVAELFRRETGMDVRLAATDQINREKNEPETKPAYATAQGILIRGIRDGRSTLEGNVRSRVETVTESASGASPARQESQQSEPVAPVEERPQRTAQTTQTAAAGMQTAQPQPQPQPARPVRPTPAAQTAPAAQTVSPAQPQRPVQPTAAGASQQPPVTLQRPAVQPADEPADGHRDEAEEQNAGTMSGAYGPIGRIHGSDDDYDDPEKNLADEDEQQNRGNIFSRAWRWAKGRVEETFSENEDVPMGGSDNRDW